MKRLSRDIRILILIAAACAAAGGIFVLGAQHASGRGAMLFAALALAEVALGAVAMLAYLCWMAFRDGWRTPAGIVVSVIAGLGVLIGVIWGASVYRENQLCGGTLEYYQDLAAAPVKQRAALIAAGGAYITNPDNCVRDGLLTWHGRKPAHANGLPPVPEADRLATLEMLLAAGLPPSHDLMLSFTRHSDVGAVRLLMARRQKLLAAGQSTWTGFPIAAASAAASFAACFDPARGPQETSNPQILRYREILAIMALSVIPPGKNVLGEQLHRRLLCLGLVPD
jgi:hypothetical protein